MKTSALGRQFIQAFEKCSTKAYRDAVGVWTIGYGRIAGVKPGDTCTAEQAAEWFAEELPLYEKTVNNSVTAPLTQWQFDALVSFAYNVGRAALYSSTLLKHLNVLQYEAAAAQFVLWDKGTVDGKLISLPGLTKRRIAERKIFRENIYDMHDGPSIDGNMPNFEDVTGGVVK